MIPKRSHHRSEKRRRTSAETLAGAHVMGQALPEGLEPPTLGSEDRCSVR